MRQLFQMDGTIFSFLSKAADLMLLNVMFIITSLPIFTIGASLTALSYATLKMKGPAEGYAWKNYLKSFKENFKQATVIWLIMLAAALVLYVDFRVAGNIGGVLCMAIRYTAMLGLLIWLMVLYYVFPVLARFVNSVTGTIKNAAMLAFANLPKTIVMFAVTGGMIFLTFYNSYTFSYGILLWLILGISLISFINSSLQYKIFEKLIPEDAKEQVSDEHWTLAEADEGSDMINTLDKSKESKNEN